jgi:hypothetical protein|nr:MAG TPA: Tor inhibition protein helix, reverse turn, PROTEIN [Caudoviricetes sp.]
MAIIKLPKASELVKNAGISKGSLCWYIQTGKIPKCFYKKENDKARGDYLIDEAELCKFFGIEK